MLELYLFLVFVTTHDFRFEKGLMIGFLLVLGVPWVLDLYGGRGVLGSFFGAGIWGAALVVAFVRSRSQHLPFKRKLEFILGFLSGAWLIFWLLSLTGDIKKIPLMESSTLQYLTWLHAGLLAAGTGVVFILALGALGWLLQDFRLRQSSWERRLLKFELPPLEALTKVCKSTLQIALTLWGAGLSLAILTTYVRFKTLEISAKEFIHSWIQDPKVFITILLWLLLLTTWMLPKWLKTQQRWIYRIYLGMSLVFLISLTLLMADSSPLHEPLDWLSR